MSKINDGGQFFPPTVVFTEEGYIEKYHGTSLRAWLAGMAMQGWYASMEPGTGISEVKLDVVAEFCANTADALIAELEKEQP